VLGPLGDEVSAAHDDPLGAWLEILRGIAGGTIELGGA
jgi:hypothetical protein